MLAGLPKVAKRCSTFSTLSYRFFRFTVQFETILNVLPLFRINTCMLLNRKLAALAFQSLSRFLNSFEHTRITVPSHADFDQNARKSGS